MKKQLKVAWPIKEITEFLNKVKQERKQEENTATLKVDKETLFKHALQFCLPNLKKKRPSCLPCPFMPQIVRIILKKEDEKISRKSPKGDRK